VSNFDSLLRDGKLGEYFTSEYVVLKHETGIHLAIMKIESIFKPDLTNEIDKVYGGIRDGKIDINHPYVKILMDYEKEGLIYCIGGEIVVGYDVPHYDFKELRNSPLKLKQKFKEDGWIDENGNYLVNIVGFQTRNPLHKSHFQLTKYALDEATKLNGKKSKLLLHPVVGVTQTCDIDYHARVKCYKELIKNYDSDEVILSLLPLSMRMAGPREVLWHAIIRKNYGVSHFIVGRDHAGPSSNRSNGNRFYGLYDAQNNLQRYADKIGIIPIVSKMIVFSMEKQKVYHLCAKYNGKQISEISDSDIKKLDFMCKLQEKDGSFKSVEHINPESEVYFEISGTQQRKLLSENKPIPSWFSYPEIILLLRREFERPNGIVFYLIGLSGSGKSTIANHLMTSIKEYTFRSITYLDGDIIRLNISKG